MYFLSSGVKGLSDVLKNVWQISLSGFIAREYFSCETQLITAINDWAKRINHHTRTDVILLDFSKAFGSVPHRCSLSKLDYYGIRGKCAGWINALLSGFSQWITFKSPTCHFWSTPRVRISDQFYLYSI